MEKNNRYTGEVPENMDEEMAYAILNGARNGVITLFVPTLREKAESDNEVLEVVKSKITYSNFGVITYPKGTKLDQFVELTMCMIQFPFKENEKGEVEIPDHFALTQVVSSMTPENAAIELLAALDKDAPPLHLNGEIKQVSIPPQ